MLWFYLAVSSTFGAALANIYRRSAMKDDRSDALASAILFQFIGTIIVGIVAFVHGFVMPPILKYPFNFGLQPIAWGIATLSLFKASEYLEASQTAIISTGASIVTVILAIIFLSEHFSFIFLLGMILVIGGITFALFEKNDIKMNKGVLYVLAFCLFAGIGTTNDAFMIGRSPDALSLLMIGFLGPGIFMFIIRPSVVKKMKEIFTSNIIYKLVTLTFFYCLQSFAYFFAIKTGGQIAQVSVINESSVVLTVLIAAVFLNERTYIPKKIFSAISAVIGVILLS